MIFLQRSIYLQDEEEGYLEEDMTILFENYWKETTGEEIKVVYDTYDTNETMLNSLKTGKSTYDLVCASDYTIQKMLANDMIIPFNRDNLSNYDEYCPEYLRNIFKTGFPLSCAIFFEFLGFNDAATRPVIFPIATSSA